MSIAMTNGEIAVRNGVIAAALAGFVVAALRRRGWNEIAVLLGILALMFGVDASMRWLTPGLRHSISVWMNRRLM